MATTSTTPTIPERFNYENTEGGHGMAANENQRACMWALTHAYLFRMLDPGSGPAN